MAEADMNVFGGFDNFEIASDITLVPSTRLCKIRFFFDFVQREAIDSPAK